MGYTTEKSITDVYGEEDVAALLAGRAQQPDPARFAKAINIARALVDSKLGASGFVLPLLFTSYDVLDADMLITDPPKLNPLLQQASDCITVYNLALTSTLMRAEFKECNDTWVNWLNALKQNRELLADYPQTATVTGKGQAVVLSRRSILDKGSENGYPGCCGRRWY